MTAITAIANVIGAILLFLFIFWCGIRFGRFDAMSEIIHMSKWDGYKWIIFRDDVFIMRDGKK